MEMERLDGFLERGRSTLHPQLVHFLQNRSYAKAVMFLGVKRTFRWERAAVAPGELEHGRR